MLPAKPPNENPHATQLARLERRAIAAVTLMVVAFVAFRVAMDVYSGPSIAVGFAITASATGVICLLLAVLPDGAREVLWYVIGLLLT